MKHSHEANFGGEASVDILVDVTPNVESLVDKVTDSALKIIAAMTIAHVIKSQFPRN